METLLKQISSSLHSLISKLPALSAEQEDPPVVVCPFCGSLSFHLETKRRKYRCSTCQASGTFDSLLDKTFQRPALISSLQRFLENLTKQQHLKLDDIPPLLNQLLADIPLSSRQLIPIESLRLDFTDLRTDIIAGSNFSSVKEALSIIRYSFRELEGFPDQPLTHYLSQTLPQVSETMKALLDCRKNALSYFDSPDWKHIFDSQQQAYPSDSFQKARIEIANVIGNFSQAICTFGESLSQLLSEELSHWQSLLETIKEFDKASLQDSRVLQNQIAGHVTFFQQESLSKELHKWRSQQARLIKDAPFPTDQESGDESKLPGDSTVANYQLKEKANLNTELAIAIFNTQSHRSNTFLDELLKGGLPTDPVGLQRFWRDCGDFRLVTTARLLLEKGEELPSDLEELAHTYESEDTLFGRTYQLLKEHGEKPQRCESPRCTFYFIPSGNGPLPHAVACDNYAMRRKDRQDYLSQLCPHEFEHCLSAYKTLSAAACAKSTNRSTIATAIEENRLFARCFPGAGRMIWLVHQADLDAYNPPSRRRSKR